MAFPSPSTVEALFDVIAAIGAVTEAAGRAHAERVLEVYDGVLREFLCEEV